MKRKTVMIYFILAAILALVFVFSLMKVSAECSMMWDKTYGGTEWDRGPSLIATSDGGYALAGYAGYVGPFSAGSGDFWLVKTDASGNIIWNQTYGGTNFDAACSLVVTSDGGYAIAGFTSSFGAGDNDFWLVKTDANGNKEWDQTYGGTGDDRAYSLVATSDGGYALAGYTLSFGAGSSDWWLVKTDASGNKIWDQTFGGTGDDYAFSLVATSDGGYAIAGESRSFKAEGSDWWLVKTDASGNKIWDQIYGETSYGGRAYSLIITSDGGYAIAGDSSSTGAEVDFCLVKADASGKMIWQKTYGETVEDTASCVVQTSDGGYAVAGFTSLYEAGGGTDAWLVKTDANGNMEWNQTFGGTGHDAADSLVQTSDGGYAVAGDTTSSGAGGYDFWLVKTEAEDTTEPSPTDGSAQALPMEYVYVAVIALLIVVVVIAVIAYMKRK